jgi:hypothetical protein
VGSRYHHIPHAQQLLGPRHHDHVSGGHDRHLDHGPSGTTTPIPAESSPTPTTMVWSRILRLWMARPGHP